MHIRRRMLSASKSLAPRPPPQPNQSSRAQPAAPGAVRGGPQRRLRQRSPSARPQGTAAAEASPAAGSQQLPVQQKRRIVPLPVTPASGQAQDQQLCQLTPQPLGATQPQRVASQPTPTTQLQTSAQAQQRRITPQLVVSAQPAAAAPASGAGADYWGLQTLVLSWWSCHTVEVRASMFCGNSRKLATSGFHYRGWRRRGQRSRRGHKAPGQRHKQRGVRNGKEAAAGHADSGAAAVAALPCILLQRHQTVHF